MNLLIEQHDADGVRAAYVRAAALGTPDAPYALVQLAEPETPAYPPGLPHEFDPANMMRTGIHVLEHGLLSLPEPLTREMAVPVAYWKAAQCAAVLVLMYSSHGPSEPEPMAATVVYSRGEDGNWKPPEFFSGSSFLHDPFRSRELTRDPGRSPMLYGGSSQAREVTAGRPAFIATGRAAPEVK